LNEFAPPRQTPTLCGSSLPKGFYMPWYEIGIDHKRPNDGRNADNLIRGTQRIWEVSGKPEGFALLGTRRTPDGKFDVYFLTPPCQQPINEHSGGFFTFWEVVPTEEKPARDGLTVLAGDPNALALLD
jgi:hypothetical protein